MADPVKPPAWQLEPETVFEWGVLGLAAAVLAGLAIMLGSDAAGRLLRRRRHREAAPEAGSAASERHRHIQALAAR